MKLFFKSSLRQVLLLLCCVLLGTLLLFLAYLLPTDRIYNNLARSEEFFASGVTYPEIIPGYRDTRLDQFTDCLMLLTAATSTDESIPYQAMNNARYSISGMDPEETFVAIFKEGSSDRSMNTGYARYWHGYLTVLKPLLTVFSYKQIISLNLMLQLFLLIALCSIYAGKGEPRFILPLAGIYVFLNPIAIYLSIQYSSVWIFTLVFLILLALLKKPIQPRVLLSFFLLAGAATSYFDLLTYPLVTLGVPLGYLVLANWSSFRKLFRDGISCAVSWGLGFGGMWASKWLVASLFTGKNVLNNALHSAEVRSSMTNEGGKGIRYGDVLLRLRYTYNGTVLKLLLIVAITVALVFLIKKNKPDPIKLSGLFLVCLLPFVWFAVLSNHTFVHFWFTYRTLSISLYCILGALTAVWVQRQNNQSQ